MLRLQIPEFHNPMMSYQGVSLRLPRTTLTRTRRGEIAKTYLLSQFFPGEVVDLAARCGDVVVFDRDETAQLRARVLTCQQYQQEFYPDEILA